MTDPVILQNPDDDPYKVLTLGITLEGEDVFGRKLETLQEAQAFEFLAAKFFTSDAVYTQFVAFANMFFKEAMLEAAKAHEHIAPSSNGKDRSL